MFPKKFVYSNRTTSVEIVLEELVSHYGKYLLGILAQSWLIMLLSIQKVEVFGLFWNIQVEFGSIFVVIFNGYKDLTLLKNISKVFSRGIDWLHIFVFFCNCKTYYFCFLVVYPRCSNLERIYWKEFFFFFLFFFNISLHLNVNKK